MAARRTAGPGKWVAIALVGIVALACAGGGGGGAARTAARCVWPTCSRPRRSRARRAMPRRWRGPSGSGAATSAQDAAGWKALAGVADLRVENGALRGRTEMPAPVLALDWTPPPEVADDKIHSIELRLRTSGGGRASFGTNAEEQMFVPALLGNPFAFGFTSPIVPGEEAKLYTLRPVTPVAVAGVRHLLLRPVDAPGAEFAIESVRVVFEREHLASIPAGLSWQGLQGTFRETLVARSPETLRFDLTLPPDPYLELAVGTLSPVPVTFEVSLGADSADSANADGGCRTVTTPQRWEDIRVDLDGARRQGRRGLSLHLDAAGGGSDRPLGLAGGAQPNRARRRAGQAAGGRGGDHRHAAPRSPLGLGLRPRHRAPPLGARRRGRGRRRRHRAGGMDQGLGAVDPHLALSRPRTRSPTSPTCCRRRRRPWPRCSAKRATPPSGSRRSRSPAR